MADELKRRRILKKEPETHLTIADRRAGWAPFLRKKLPRGERERMWEIQNHCGLSVDDDGALLYLSFAHHKIVRFPTLTGRMVK